jgi:short-subunit dehydrogenase
MNVNFMSCIWCTFAAIPYMLRDGGGSVVNVSSFAALVVPPREAVYAASKSAMEGFTAGLWNELHGSGIHVALVRPGAIDTEIWNKQLEPNAYRGGKTPAREVVDAILDVVERRRREVTVPGRSAGLVSARLLRTLAPSLLVRAVRRMDPVRPEEVERARARARRGRRLGDVED